VKGKDRHGKVIRIRAESLMAEALEHEIDHLSGVLYVDHVESEDKLHTVEELEGRKLDIED
jgi:peptide deformylase